MYSEPLIILSNGKAVRLERVDFTQKDLDEGFLQEIIRANPSVLPAHELDKAYTQLISIGREASTVAGSIDNLLATPEGNLVIVETKLWRNPQARREVIAQIIDYAKDLSSWTYDDFDAVAKAYSRRYLSKQMSLSELMQSQFPQFDEKVFHDNLLRNIELGRVMLLVVGDGIREGVEQMVEYLQTYATLHFTLGLVELQLYKIGEGDTLVLSQLLFRTREINRAIITVSGAKIGEVNVSLDSTLEVESQVKRAGRKTWDEESFFEHAQENLPEEHFRAVKRLHDYSRKRAYSITWGTGTLSGSFNPRFEKTGPRSPFTIYSDGKMQLNFDYIDDGEVGRQFRKEWADALARELKLPVTRESKFPIIDPEHWVPNVEKFISIFDSLLEKN
jgi:L-fucose mutarotase/ribose pyranase (RbsD/FucU family)